MKNKFRHLAVLLLPVLLASCQKEDPAPTYHKDIFRCKVNGVEWAATCPSDGLFGCEPIDCQYYWKDTKTFEISALNERDNGMTNTSMSFAGYGYLGDNIVLSLKRNFKDWNKPGNCGFYDLDTTQIRRLAILEVDTVNFLIKGTFEFSAIDNYSDCKDTVKITDGYFHVNFRF
jgi:hypothetical protein